MAGDQFIVIKFGGTSVSSLACWRNILLIAEQHLRDGFKPVIVCSAITQMTNRFEQLIASSINNEAKQVLGEIQARYLSLADELSVDGPSLLLKDFDELTHLVKGIELLGEASPRIRARVLAFGELMLTKIGAAFLSQNGLDLCWQDARELLITEENSLATETDRYLSTTCAIDYRPHIAALLSQHQSKVIITQGFIAANAEGETVLLGRGGSDTSAAYLAALINAERCEIWTDVPGIYTSNPRDIPQARLLKQLDYEEAQEIASMGAKVVHPNAIEPLKIRHIPMHIRYTQQPNFSGTIISLESDTSGVQIKAIVNKPNILLIHIETLRMWKCVGFLADVFNCFKKHGLSVDLISTAETTITVSVDNADIKRNEHVLEDLIAELKTFANARIIGPCAAISLVGRHIRMILHKLWPVFEIFESQKIYLLSQSANDLNLTLVVDEDRAESLTKKLHVMLIEQHPRNYFLGESWDEKFGEPKPLDIPWWQSKREALLTLGKSNSALYVYDQATLENSVNSLKSCQNINQIFYAMKANSNEKILNLFHKMGLGFECTSINEMNRIFELFPDIHSERILFTPNFAEKSEYIHALNKGTNVTIDNSYILRAWPECFANKKVLLRIDPGYGAGHHKFVCTGGEESKFGIALNDLPEIAEIAATHHIEVIGLHAHSGSGILQANIWQETAVKLTSLLHYFPSVRILNIGGGLGVVEKPGQIALDIAEFDASLLSIKEAFPQLSLWLEPGRYLVALAGVLISKVTQVKQKGETHFIGISTGMNSLIRPSLYGAYHEIVNLSKLNEPKEYIANIVGPICESGDVLGYSRLLPKTTEGDVLLIATTGAYGRSMSSFYNLRPPAEEVMI
jgi:diaminopimelate decarboxylase/aspartate kinase